MIYFTSDLHFGHKNILKFCARPYLSISEMDNALIQNWNACIKKNEHVYVLGDFSFSNKERTTEIIKQLNGYKIIILGNHDSHAKKMLDMGFDRVFENHKIRINDTELLLSHFPYHPQSNNEQDQRYLHKRILDDGKSWLLHGHVHEAWDQKARMINVGVDVRNYKPVSHETILSIIKKDQGTKVCSGRNKDQLN